MSKPVQPKTSMYLGDLHKHIPELSRRLKKRDTNLSAEVRKFIRKLIQQEGIKSE